MHTIVFVHGFGEDSGIWETITPAFKGDYQVLTPDLPGCGSVAAGDTTTMDSMADYLYTWLQEKNISRCSLIGHSMGGYVALAFAERYPGTLDRLGLFHSTAYADNAEKIEARKKNIQFIAKHGTRKFLEQSAPKLFSEQWATQNPAKVQAFISRYSYLPPQTLISYTEAMMDRPDRVHVLKSFAGPVLLILGEYDTAVPLEQGLKLCSVPEFSYIYIAANSGHLGMLEEPDFCVKALKDFISADLPRQKDQ